MTDFSKLVIESGKENIMPKHAEGGSDARFFKDQREAAAVAKYVPLGPDPMRWGPAQKDYIKIWDWSHERMVYGSVGGDPVVLWDQTYKNKDYVKLLKCDVHRGPGLHGVVDVDNYSLWIVPKEFRTYPFEWFVFCAKHKSIAKQWRVSPLVSANPVRNYLQTANWMAIKLLHGESIQYIPCCRTHAKEVTLDVYLQVPAEPIDKDDKGMHSEEVCFKARTYLVKPEPVSDHELMASVRRKAGYY